MRTGCDDGLSTTPEPESVTSTLWHTTGPRFGGVPAVPQQTGLCKSHSLNLDSFFSSLFLLSTQNQHARMGSAFRQIAPAPLRPPPRSQPRVTFYDLPAELRIEVYKLALEGVVIHILPLMTVEERKIPHPLTRASRQVRNEVLPMIHSICPIRCSVTDFSFDGLLAWMHRIPPDEQTKLLKNDNLVIRFHTTSNSAPKGLDSLRKWLHYRADTCRPQPKWIYQGTTPPSKTCADLRRRAKRMTESGKQAELYVILKALGIPCQSAEREGRSRNST